MYNLITQLKTQYDPLFLSDFEGDSYIWRLLTRSEQAYLSGLGLDEMEMEDEVCKICVLYPKVEWKFYKAGVSKGLYQLIINESGFKDRNQASYLYEFYKSKIENDTIKKMEIIINLAFSVSLEEMATWDIATLFKKYTEAEFKLEIMNKVNTLPNYKVELSFNQEADEEVDQTEILRNNGLDPMSFIRKEDLKPDKNFVQFPFIVGNHDFIYGTEWEDPVVNEGLYNEIQRQLLERKHKRGFSSSKTS